MARLLECWLVLDITLLLWQTAIAQQLPFQIAIAYQRVDNLTEGQRALLESVVTAAYGTLREYVRAKSPASALLCEQVCRSYRVLPPPPPPLPLPPSPPPAPPRPDSPSLPPTPSEEPSGPTAQPSQRRTLQGSLEPHSLPNTGSHSEAAAAAPVAAAVPIRGDSSGSGGGGSGSGGQRAATRAPRTQTAVGDGSGAAAAPRARRCYPDFSAASTDPRQVLCGLAGVSPAHVRDPEPAVTAAAADGSGTSMAGGPGQPAHTYLYVTADTAPSECASAASGKGMQSYTCLYDKSTGRPTMASINICPQALDLYDVDSLIARVLRELLRALGVERVGFFGMAPVESYTSYVVHDTDPGGMLTRFLATPRVKQTVREFFGCETAPGALLEDSYFTDGTKYDSSVIAAAGEVLDDPDYAARAAVAFVGWETTHFQGDLLIADPDPGPVSGLAPQVTALTLALLYDTTWYDVAAGSEAGAWSWGRGSGCALATRHCATLLANLSGDGDGDGVWAGGGGIAEFVGARGEVLFCDPAKYDRSTRHCPPESAAVGTCRSRPITTGTTCGLITSVTPRLATCTARELEVAALSDGDVTVAATFGWAAAASSSHCLPLKWPWIATAPVGGSATAASEVGSAAAAAAAAADGAVSFPNPSSALNSPFGASCFRTSCSAAGDLMVHVLGAAVRCPAGAWLNLTATAAGNVGGGRLQRALLGPCPDPARLCSGGGTAATAAAAATAAVSGAASCDATTCSSRGGDCRPAAWASSAASAVGGRRCFCRPGYGGAACQQYRGTAMAASGGGVLGAAEEDLAGLAEAFAVLEASVLLDMALPDFLLQQGPFLAAIGGIVSGSGIPQHQLAVARVYGMSYIPALASGAPSDAYDKAQPQPQVQAVIRLLAASAAQKDRLQKALLLGVAVNALAAGLAAARFPVSAGGVSYLGEAELRAPAPQAPPRPPPSSPPQPLPLSLPPSAPPASGRSRGLSLSGDEKAALGVGVTFGTLLLLLAALMLGCSLKHAKARRSADGDSSDSKQKPGVINRASEFQPSGSSPPPAPSTASGEAAAAGAVGAGGHSPAGLSRLAHRNGLPPKVAVGFEIQLQCPPESPGPSLARAPGTVMLQLAESRADGDGTIGRGGGGGGKGGSAGERCGGSGFGMTKVMAPPPAVVAAGVGSSGATAGSAARAGAVAATAGETAAAASGGASGSVAGCGGDGAPEVAGRVTKAAAAGPATTATVASRAAPTAAAGEGRIGFASPFMAAATPLEEAPSSYIAVMRRDAEFGRSPLP